ncbi:hypothetical protein P3T27_006550 [Kitasatospora sp. MAA19]|uniref:hypothetical protein n=1 Tax=Kitasatospora sp. MAA19 TaxID=3035090 RepID=UPI002473F0EB|nr:hypothetical protein [Kitasatospora sp. MAA19]MDH6709801.1 hypothetical protein [Kitasatospora sp. MAA19]
MAELPVRRPMRDAAELERDFEVMYGPRSNWPEDVSHAYAAAVAGLRGRWLRGEIW